MMTPMEAPDPQHRQLRENIAVMMQRVGIKGAHLAQAVGMTPATFSRRMHGQTTWLFHEFELIASYFDLTLDELAYRLPSADDWERRGGRNTP